MSGKIAQERGYQRLYLIAPNCRAGKDAISGFKIDFKGEVIEESHVPLNTLDFQSELAKVADMKPDAIFAFLPGGIATEGSKVRAIALISFEFTRRSRAGGEQA